MMNTNLSPLSSLSTAIWHPNQRLKYSFYPHSDQGTFVAPKEEMKIIIPLFLNRR